MGKRTIGKCILLMALVLVCCFVELFVFNDITAVEKSGTMDLDLRSAKVKDSVLENAGALTAVSSDPGLIFSDIDQNVSTLRITLSNTDPEAVLQSFFGYHGIRGYDESNSYKVHLNGGVSQQLIIPIDPSQRLDSLRLDYTNREADTVTIQRGPELTIARSIAVSPLRVIGYLFLLAIAALVVFGGWPKRSLRVLLGDSRVEEYSGRAFFALESIKTRHVAIAVAAIFVLAVAAKANMSSIGYWDKLVVQKGEGYSYPHIGVPRGVRSDEWMVSSTWIAAQEAERFPLVNPNIRSDGQNMLATGAPVLHPVLLFQPANWGYVLLGFDRGLSWAWFGTLLLIFLTSFELVRILTKGKSSVAFIFAFVISLAPPVQWWSGLVWIGYMQLGVVGFYHYFQAHKATARIGWGAITILGYGSLFFTMYPPFVVPGFFLSLFIIVPLAIRDKLYKNFRTIDAVIIPAYVALFGAVIYLYFRDLGNVFSIIQGTAYPGKRVGIGHDTPFDYLKYFIINPFLGLREPPMLNQCELASFVPFFIPVLAFYIARRKANPLVIFLFVFSAIAYLFAFIGLPVWLAKASLLSMTTGPRLFLVAGLAGTYLAAIAMGDMGEKSGMPRDRVMLTMATVTCCLLAFFLISSAISGNINAYADKWALASSLCFLLYFVFLIFGNRKLFGLSSLLAAVVMGAFVNPIAIGSDPLMNNAISREIRSITASDQSGGLWVSTEGQMYAALAYANGAHALNGIEYYPDLSLWKKLDPDGSQAGVYNRYAHVAVSITPGPSKFTLLGGDSFSVSIDPSRLSELKVKYLITKRPLAELEAEGLQLTQVYHDDRDSLSILQMN